MWQLIMLRCLDLGKYQNSGDVSLKPTSIHSTFVHDRPSTTNYEDKVLQEDMYPTHCIYNDSAAG